jgi:hypothetical protein
MPTKKKKAAKGESMREEAREMKMLKAKSTKMKSASSMMNKGYKKK